MGAAEIETFGKVSIENYQRWITPFVDHALEASNLKKGSVLDVGCGPGLLVKEFAGRSKKFSVAGIDISLDALRLAKKNCKGMKNTSFVAGSANQLPFKDKAFDMVVCKDSLHHFNNPKGAIREMERVTKRGGVIYLQDLRRDLPRYLLKMAIPPDTIFKKLQFYSARASYTKPEVRALLEKGLPGCSSAVKTRMVTRELARRYQRKGVPSKQLRVGFQSRYVVIIRKRRQSK